MKKLIFSLLLLFFAHISFAQTQEAVYFPKEDFSLKLRIENQTGMRLFGIHVCKTYNPDNEPDVNDWKNFAWSDDLIPSRHFEDAQLEELTIPLTPNTSCNWDIMVTDAENDISPIIFNNVDFCHATKILFFRKGDKIMYNIF